MLGVEQLSYVSWRRVYEVILRISRSRYITKECGTLVHLAADVVGMSKIPGFLEMSFGIDHGFVTPKDLREKVEIQLRRLNWLSPSPHAAPAITLSLKLPSVLKSSVSFGWL